MELSLSGSQICLATRDKPSTPTIKYPLINQYRPSSAAIILQTPSSSTSAYSPALHTITNNTQQKRLDYQQSLGKPFNKRPLSADTKFYTNNATTTKHLNCIHNNNSNNQFTKFSTSGVGAAVGAARCEYFKQKSTTIQSPPSSGSSTLSSPTISAAGTAATNFSTNIFNLLVKEKIKRTTNITPSDDSFGFTKKSIVDHQLNQNRIHNQNQNNKNQLKNMTETNADDYQINEKNTKENLSNNNHDDDDDDDEDANDDDDGIFLNETIGNNTKSQSNRILTTTGSTTKNPIPKKNVSFNNNHDEIIQLTSISPSSSSHSSSSSPSSSSKKPSRKQFKNWQINDNVDDNNDGGGGGDDDDDDGKQIDLPGRVSFNNNPYGINYNDYRYDIDNHENYDDHDDDDDDEDNDKNADNVNDYNNNLNEIESNQNNDTVDGLKNCPNSNEINAEPLQSLIERNNNQITNNNNNNSKNYCCSLKCNSKLFNDDDDDRDFTNNSIFTKNDNTNKGTNNSRGIADDHHHHDNESNKIIDQYKREIKSIQSDDAENHSTIDKSNGYLKNNNNKNTIQSSNESTTSASNTKTNDITNDIIKNYLKVTNQEASNHHVANHQIKRNNNIVKTSSILSNREKSNNFPNTIPIGKNIQSTSTKKTSIDQRQQQQPPSFIKSLETTKIKQSNLNTKKSLLLTEFQIDNVESWMSVYDRNFQKTTLNNSQINQSLNSHQSINDNYYDNDDDDEQFVDLQISNQRQPLKTNDEQNNNYNLYKNHQQLNIDNNPNESKTYNDIVAVIKEIDENNIKLDDQKYDDNNDGSHRIINETVATAAATIQSNRSQSSFVASSHPDRSNNQRTNSNYLMSSNDLNQSHDDSDKIKEILLYLDEVDTKCEQTIQDVYSLKMPDSSRSEIEFTIEPDIIGDLPKMNDLILLPNHQLARRIIALTLRANEITNAIQLSKEHMGNVRNEKQKSIRLEKQSTQNRLKEQKLHYENIITRHQGFIEQLLKDKSMLCEKMNAQTRRFDSQNQAWEHKLETELDQSKQIQMAGEKIRREKWVRENTKKIKELTVKGVENEINKMTIDHQRQIMDLKKEHQQAILDAIEQTRNKHELIELAIRNSYAQDRELAIEKERNAIRLRFERQLTNEQKSFEEEKSRLIGEMNVERLKYNDELKLKEREYERGRIELQQKSQQCIDESITEYKNKLKIQIEKHQNELKSMEKQFEMDYQIWKKDCENQWKIAGGERENQLREQLRLERDRQIDAIIAKVDTENLKSQQDFEIKLNRLQDKYEKELGEIEKAEQKTKEMYLETRSKLSGTEVNLQHLQSTVKQLEIQLMHSQKSCDEYAQEKENFKEMARKEIQFEIGAMKTEQNCEIQRIYKRVQQAIEKKDASVELLQKENGDLKERCIKLEAIVRQQRKDYCTK